MWLIDSFCHVKHNGRFTLWYCFKRVCYSFTPHTLHSHSTDIKLEAATWLQRWNENRYCDVLVLFNKSRSLSPNACFGWYVCLFVYVFCGVCWQSQGLAYSGLLEFRPAQEQMCLVELRWHCGYRVTPMYWSGSRMTCSGEIPSITARLLSPLKGKPAH